VSRASGNGAGPVWRAAPAPASASGPVRGRHPRRSDRRPTARGACSGSSGARRGRPRRPRPAPRQIHPHPLQRGARPPPPAGRVPPRGPAGAQCGWGRVGGPRAGPAGGRGRRQLHRTGASGRTLGRARGGGGSGRWGWGSGSGGVGGRPIAARWMRECRVEAPRPRAGAGDLATKAKPGGRNDPSPMRPPGAPGSVLFLAWDILRRRTQWCGPDEAARGGGAGVQQPGARPGGGGGGAPRRRRATATAAPAGGARRQGLGAAGGPRACRRSGPRPSLPRPGPPRPHQAPQRAPSGAPGTAAGGAAARAAWRGRAGGAQRAARRARGRPARPAPAAARRRRAPAGAGRRRGPRARAPGA
jgi:translation initiation factor IF-2